MSPSETLRDFLVRRAGEIDVASNALYERLAVLEDERAQIDKAAAAAGVVLGHASEPAAPAPESATSASGTDDAESAAGRAGARAAKRAPEATIKEAVLEVLAAAGHGMTALEILPAINARLGIDYPRTSLSPQLSRLKNIGALDRVGHEWRLAERLEAPMNKGPDADASEPLEETGLGGPQEA